MKFSSLQEISAYEGTTSLLDQPSVAKVSKILRDHLKPASQGRFKTGQR
jgi:hypothetical protein